jgi:hypothetical protein
MVEAHKLVALLGTEKAIELLRQALRQTTDPVIEAAMIQSAKEQAEDERDAPPTQKEIQEAIFDVCRGGLRAEMRLESVQRRLEKFERADKPKVSEP